MTGVNSLPCGWDLRKEKNIPGVVQDLAMVPHMPLTSDAARHVGDPVAVVIAESQDGGPRRRRAGRVDWEVLPSVTDTEKAAAPGAAQIHAGAPGQRRLQVGDRRRGDHRRRLQERRPSSSRSASSTSGWWPTPWSRAPAWPATRTRPAS